MVCTPGEQKCIGFHSFICNTFGEWALLEYNAPECVYGPPPPPPEPEPEPEPEPTPTDEELLYANWLRTGGTGSMAYWRSLGSPLFYTPLPEPEPEYPSTDIKDITIVGVLGPEYPETDIKEITLSVFGPEYPATDIKDITIVGVLGPEYPETDIKDITIGMLGAIPEEPEKPEEPGEKEAREIPWVPIGIIAGGVGILAVASIKPNKTKGGHYEYGA